MEEIHKTEQKIADLQQYLKGLHAALKQEEDNEMIKSIRGMKLDSHALHDLLNVDFSLFRPLEFFVDPKNGDGRNNNPPAMRVRVDCYTKKLPFRVQ